MENPVEMDDLGVPPFMETSICLKLFLDQKCPAHLLLPALVLQHLRDLEISGVQLAGNNSWPLGSLKMKTKKEKKKEKEKKERRKMKEDEGSNNDDDDNNDNNDNDENDENDENDDPSTRKEKR